MVSNQVVEILGKPRRCYTANDNLLVCGARLYELEGVRFNDIPDGLRIIVDPRGGMRGYEYLWSRIPVLIDKISFEKYLFRIKLWLPQPYVLGYPWDFYMDLFKNIAIEAERLGFEVYLNLNPLDILPRFYELALLRLLSPRERTRGIVDVLVEHVNKLGSRALAWISMIRELR